MRVLVFRFMYRFKFGESPEFCAARIQVDAVGMVERRSQSTQGEEASRRFLLWAARRCLKGAFVHP